MLWVFSPSVRIAFYFSLPGRTPPLFRGWLERHPLVPGPPTRGRDLGLVDVIVNVAGIGGIPDEQVAAIAFLASDDASCLNGVALDVNGGLFVA